MVPMWSANVPAKLLELKATATEWFKYYVAFRKAAPFISGTVIIAGTTLGLLVFKLLDEVTVVVVVVVVAVLIFVHAWVECALIAILITHLTDGWLHLPKAASIVNVQDGMTAVLVLVVAYVSDAYLGPFLAVVCTNIAYITGLMLLFFAAWRLPNVQLQLLYVSVLLVALGRAGREVLLKEFLADQFRKEGSSQDEERVQSRRKVWWRSAYILGICASVYVFANTSWIKLSKISTIAMAAAFLWFLAGIVFYKRKPPTNKSRLNDAFQVMYAAISKRNLNHTPSENVIPILRCLDKASIVEPSPSPEEQIRKGRLWEVEDVQEVKRLLSMIPLWITFLVYGLLQATGNTFFYEQVNYMDTHLGRISSVPVVIFLIVKSSTSFVVSRICDLLFPYYWGEKVPRDVMLTVIGAGMAASPICCIVAWRIENYRLQKYVNLDVSITFFWLVPQFFLLGLMEGLVFGGMQEMFYALVPESFKHYGPSFTQFSLNIGNFLSLLAILVFHGLFSDDLNTSSLGTYYALLGYVCFVNLLFYCGVATYYVKESDREKEPLLVQEAKQHLEQEIPQAVEQAQNW